MKKEEQLRQKETEVGGACFVSRAEAALLKCARGSNRVVLCRVAWTTLPRNIKRVSPWRVPLYLVTVRSTYLQYLRVEVGAVDGTARG